ncbi:MAG: hypothetical protein JRJ15_15745 [Deltaproteobacteria bacterium]|nr:hypothetical protein [Deltaproteobacteria bacterium]
MRPKCIGLLSALLIIVGTAAGSFANVEWSPEHTFQMDQSPLDMAVSPDPDGKHIFILTESGIFVYSQDGKLEDKIDVGYPVDQMKIGPGGKQLFITSRKNKTVQAVTIDFIVFHNQQEKQNRSGRYHRLYRKYKRFWLALQGSPGCPSDYSGFQ